MSALPPFGLRFEFAPWRLTGTVYGALLNDPATLAALGDAVDAPPYKAPPRAPVLAIKPRNTLAADGAAITVPADAGQLEIGASLAIVIGRTACRVRAADAAAHVAGWTLVADLGVAQDGHYRPAVRFKARDGTCLIGPQVMPRSALVDADAVEITVSIDGRPVHVVRTAAMQRGVAQLLQDVSEFMTLRPGDLLLLGAAHGAPRARAGQRFELACTGLGTLHGRLVAAEVPA